MHLPTRPSPQSRSKRRPSPLKVSLCLFYVCFGLSLLFVVVRTHNTKSTLLFVSAQYSNVLYSAEGITSTDTVFLLRLCHRNLPHLPSGTYQWCMPVFISTHTQICICVCAFTPICICVYVCINFLRVEITFVLFILCCSVLRTVSGTQF